MKTDDAIVAESVWNRSEFASIWKGPDLELVVVAHPRTDAWQWTCQGWKGPDDIHGADAHGWVWAPTQRAAEIAAMAFYLDGDT